MVNKLQRLWKWCGSLHSLSDLAFDRELPTGQVCFKLGSDSSKLKTITETSDRCPCKPNYFGEDCGIPDAAWFGHYKVNPTFGDYDKAVL